MTKQLNDKIVSWLTAATKQSVSMEELAQGLGLEQSKDFKDLVQVVAQMERTKDLEFTRKGKIQLPQKDQIVTGLFRKNERGFGFVTIDPEEPDVYIAKNATGYALDGDQVQVEFVQAANFAADKGAEGRIVGIAERKATQLVGEFVPFAADETADEGLYGKVIPKDKKLKEYDVLITANGLQPVEGAICSVEITHYPDAAFPHAIQGIVKQVIGHKNDPGMDILTIVLQHGIPTEFPADVLEQADAVPQELTAADYAGREDLRDQTIVTIDGEDAKDLDDAVTVKRLENGNYFLGVHIADVSYYVTENSPLDREAFERGTSVYLTDRVIPMIPHRLSNGLCSLNPRVPRLVLSCEMEIDTEGTVIKHRIFESVIQTTERMTYTAVNQILEEQDGAVREQYASLVPMFEDMQKLHELLERKRARRGAISFEDQEAKIAVDEAGRPQEILLRTRGVGERVIESFMLAANETVAEHYTKAKLPFIYRIHEHPKEEKMQRFLEFVTTFGLVVKGTKTAVDPRDLQAVLADVAGTPEESVINTMLLRSMQQARYAEDPIGHYGLAADDYTHFTSPIRRYPDLLVHRLIRTYFKRPVSDDTKAKWNEAIPEIADHSSKMERRAVDAERETDSMKKAEFMQDKVGEEFEGVISSVTKFGLFIQLSNTVEGLVHIQKLSDDYYHFVEQMLALVGERTKKMYRIGQPVTIRVEKADPETREIDFELIQAEEVTYSGKELPFPKRQRSGERGGNGRNRSEKRRNAGGNDRSKTRYEGKQPGGNASASKRKKKKKPYYSDAVKKPTGKRKKGRKG